MLPAHHTGVAPPAEVIPSPAISPGLPSPGAGADQARLAELHDRALLVDRCAVRISRTAEGSARLALLRHRLLLSMRAAGLPESRWVRVGRVGLYLEPRPEPASSPTGPTYRLHTAPWAAVRLAFAAKLPVDNLCKGDRARVLLLAARLRASVHGLAHFRGGSGS